MWRDIKHKTNYDFLPNSLSFWDGELVHDMI